MKLEEAIKVLKKIRERCENHIKTLEENNAILKRTGLDEVLKERRAEFEAIDTVLKELDTLQMNYKLLEEKFDGSKAEMRKVAWEEGYNQGYLAGAMERI